jgi:hypothetical protein
MIVEEQKQRENCGGEVRNTVFWRGDGRELFFV